MTNLTQAQKLAAGAKILKPTASAAAAAETDSVASIKALIAQSALKSGAFVQAALSRAIEDGDDIDDKLSRSKSCKAPKDLVSCS